MKAKFIIIFIFILFNNLLIGQKTNCYYRFFYNSSAKYKLKQFDEAANYLNKAAMIQELPNNFLFYNAKVQAKANNKENTIAYLKKVIRYTPKTWDDIEQNQDFKNCLDSNAYSSLKDEYPLLKMQYYEDMDLKLINELETMYQIEKFLRVNNMGNFMNKTDSIHLSELKKIITKNGFPKYSRIGRKGMDNLKIIVMHGTSADTSQFIYFKTLLEDEVNKGNFSPFDFAQFVDRHQVFIRNEPQIYGTFNSKTTGEIIYNPIFDIKNLDKRRLSIGLHTLSDFNKSQKIINYPDGYEVMENPIINCK